MRRAVTWTTRPPSVYRLPTESLRGHRECGGRVARVPKQIDQLDHPRATAQKSTRTGHLRRWHPDASPSVVRSNRPTNYDHRALTRRAPARRGPTARAHCRQHRAYVSGQFGEEGVVGEAKVFPLACGQVECGTGSVVHQRTPTGLMSIPLAVEDRPVVKYLA